MEPSTQKLQINAVLDTRGRPGPDSYQQALERLAQMAEQEVLELHIDEGEPLRTIPYGLRAVGHEILVSEPAKQGVRLLVRKRAPLE